MTVELQAIVLAAASPENLGRFWAHALRWDLVEAEGGGVAVLPTDVTRFHLLIRTPATAKAGQNPIHFDLTTSSLDDQQRTVDELVSLGGRHIDIGQSPDETHVVLADPEGNELCIIEPGNRFLASCPRLGAVNGDGTSALGYFFRDALDWPLVWDQDEETAIQAPDGTGPRLTWSGPPLLPKAMRERFHLHVAPTAGTASDRALEHLLGVGATRLADGGPSCPDALVALADVDGNLLCLCRGLR